MRPSTTRCASTCWAAKGFSKQKAQKNEMLPAALPVVQASKFELVTEVCYPFGRKHGRHRAVKRREFITLLGVAAAWPLAARAQQQPAMPVIGFLSGGSPNAFAHLVASFREGLSQTGYIEHRNVGIDYRWAEGRYDLLPTLAADLVNRGVAVIASTGGPRVVEAAAAATTTVPIVFLGSDVALKTGVLTSLNRPSGNVTGIVMSTSAAPVQMPAISQRIGTKGRNDRCTSEPEYVEHVRRQGGHQDLRPTNRSADFYRNGGHGNRD